MPRLILGLMLCAAAGGLAAQQLNEVQAIKLGERIVELEVARTSVEHRTGLMHREAMPENHGMLFIFAAPAASSPGVFTMMFALLSLR